MDKNAKLYIAGHKGLFGNALCKEAKRKGFTNIVVRRHEDLDLTRQAETEEFFKEERPMYVIMAAALVGGIDANTRYMADFCIKNMQMTCNVLDSAHKFGVKKLLYLGSSCIYPRVCEQPLKEKNILTGSCEPTNEGYALAKITGIRLCQYYKKQYGNHFISCIPANVYGPNDCFDPVRAHVIPALLMRFHTAKIENKPSVTVWGSGKAEREFLYIEDAAQGCIKLLESYDELETVNIGVGHTDSIRALAMLIKKIVGYEGEILFDNTKPDGMPRRLLDTEIANKCEIYAHTSLAEGLNKTYQWYLKMKDIL